MWRSLYQVNLCLMTGMLWMWHCESENVLCVTSLQYSCLSRYQHVTIRSDVLYAYTMHDKHFSTQLMTGLACVWHRPTSAWPTTIRIEDPCSCVNALKECRSIFFFCFRECYENLLGTVLSFSSFFSSFFFLALFILVKYVLYSIYLPRRDGRLSWPRLSGKGTVRSWTRDLATTSPTP